MFDEYDEQIQSCVADIKNVGEGRWGGAITAAKFLEQFVDDKPWVHIDIAGPSFLGETQTVARRRRLRRVRAHAGGISPPSARTVRRPVHDACCQVAGDVRLRHSPRRPRAAAPNRTQPTSTPLVVSIDSRVPVTWKRLMRCGTLSITAP